MGTIVQMDMYQSAGVGVLALLLGILLTRLLPFLKRFCIPAPVSGGLLVSCVTLALFSLCGVECRFDGTIKDLCMMLFFTSVGFQSDLKMLKKGGRPLIIMIVLVAVLIASQNMISVGIARGLGLSPLFGMAAGSIPMCGGHGTSGGFAPLLEQMGLKGATTITMAAATFGLVAGSLLGGPLGGALIRKRRLEAQSPVAQTSVSPGTQIKAQTSVSPAPESEPGTPGTTPHSTSHSLREWLTAACLLFMSMALGTLMSRLLSSTGITFPTYFGSLLVACLIRNLIGISPKLTERIVTGKEMSIGEISLQLFLGMAMASLRLWELASLALPLCLILAAQVLFMALYAAYVAFPLLGKDYDSAVLVSGLCGFGLGATPNAMANMSAVCYKYHYSARPFIIVPIIGAMFVDIINTGVITFFLNIIR